ncbi:MAG: type II toxin-antitoxin system death-on-curing family toxin [Chloroflexi bacterium]|nr:type II toxin-antitoxin system death-on-curing family toxin [Chloroflexota bacterium]
MRSLSVREVLGFYRQIMDQSGGVAGILNVDPLEAALAQPRATFGGKELYRTVVEKAASLGFSIIEGHPFVDGNKRLGHAAMEVFLLLNGFEVDASTDEQERVILNVAAGKLDR